MNETRCLGCNGKIDYNPTIIEKPFWCNMVCKKRFLLDHYDFSQAKVWFAEEDKKLKISQKKVMEEIKKSGLTFTEYIRSLGDKQ